MKPQQQPAPVLQDSTDLSPGRSRATLLCLSHLRWNFAWQRPQQVMSRLARDYEVWFFEEPVFDEHNAPRLDVQSVAEGVTLLVPVLLPDQGEQPIINQQRQLLDGWLAQHPVATLLLWYYTPMSLRFTRHLAGQVVVFDCMDELSAFRQAPLALAELQRQLLERVDVVFTAGRRLCELIGARHANVHWVPNAVDRAHFASVHLGQPEPTDQAGIGQPRLGFFGVLDERLDIALLRELAMRRPGWQIVLIGPLARIYADSLPRRPNLHYLGARAYQELPAYLAGWDVALMPFAINEATRFISPIKILEYLAGGRPVVSTPVHEVVEEYADNDMVQIAATTQSFIEAVGVALSMSRQPERLMTLADQALQGRSWDSTCVQMKAQIDARR